MRHIQARGGPRRPEPGASDNIRRVKSSPFDRGLFLTAAAFNLAVAAAFAVPHSPAWRMARIAPPSNLLFVHLCVVFIALFGGAYAWVAFDVSARRALIVVGAFGKVAVFVTISAHVLAGNAPWSILPLVAGDLAFAALFLRVLSALPAPPRSTPEASG
jgi:hypothetical protein